MQHRPKEQHPVPNFMRTLTLVMVTLFIVVGFGWMIYRLYVLQLRDADSNRAKAVEQQLSDSLIPATRGNIYTSTGKLLAKSTVMWNVWVDPSNCNQNFVEEASRTIADLLGDDVSAESILEKLSDTDSKYKVIAKNIDMPTAQAILEYTNTKRWVNEDGLPVPEGTKDARERKVLYFYTEQTAQREYPNGSFMAPVLGFCGADGEGLYGLEKSYNAELAGTPGRSISTQNAWGYDLIDEEGQNYDPIDGYNLNLTIDENIQAVVEEYLAQAIEEYNVQNRGAGIVMNVNTGEIYAMATVDQFDANAPNVIGNEDLQAILDAPALDAASIDKLKSRLGLDSYNPGEEELEIRSYFDDGQLSDAEYTRIQGMIREAQWKNKCVTELYYPGSVFKLITAASALDSGLMDTSQQFYCGGKLVVNEGTVWEHSYRCAQGNTHGWQDMAAALNNSCNLYFIQVAEKMSPEFFYNYYQAFGLTERSGIDLPAEARGVSKTQEQMETVTTDLFSTAFGQTQKLTLIQMATAVAATVNGGYLVTPHVVDTITDTGGNVVREVGTEIKRQVISEEVSEMIRKMMEANVGHGEDSASCRNAYVAGYRIGGKSGTAEQLDRNVRGDGDYHKQISFAAALPIDDPEILVYVMLDDPRWIQDYASQIVAPLVGNIINEVAPYLGIERDASYDANATVKVPNAIGSRWSAAQVELNKRGLSHQIIGSGTSIVYQYPYGGTEVPAGSTVYFYTDTMQDNKTVVPDAYGKTGSFAQQMFKAAGLNVRVEGSLTGRVVSQDVESGTSAAYGTIVTLQTTDEPLPDTAEPEPSEETEDSDTGAE